MKQLHYGIRGTFCVLGIVLLGIAGCSSVTNQPPTTPPNLPEGTYNYELDISNLRPLDTTTGEYVLWLQMLGDSSLYRLPLNSWKRPAGSLNFSGTFELPRTPDSIQIALVSIEAKILPSIPSDTLLAGAFRAVQDTARLTSVAGDYSNAEASAIFTTRSSDTNRARQEFYLMRFSNGVPLPTALDLPEPPEGWAYGLWVLDSNFYPKHKFFYGWFLNADSASSDWEPGEYPFPGGFDPAPLDDPGARLEVTLEPQPAIVTNQPTAPSPLTILWAQLRRFIDFNDTLPLVNVWQSTVPEGKLTISK